MKYLEKISYISLFLCIICLLLSVVLCCFSLTEYGKVAFIMFTILIILYGIIEIKTAPLEE